MWIEKIPEWTEPKKNEHKTRPNQTKITPKLQSHSVCEIFTNYWRKQ
jgi:hypothetical protein